MVFLKKTQKIENSVVDLGWAGTLKNFTFTLKIHFFIPCFPLAQPVVCLRHWLEREFRERNSVRYKCEKETVWLVVTDLFVELPFVVLSVPVNNPRYI